MSQKTSILSHLQKHGKITPIEALQNYGCFRLGARIHELKKDGYNIFSDINIGKKKYAVYTLTF